MTGPDNTGRRLLPWILVAFVVGGGLLLAWRAVKEPAGGAPDPRPREAGAYLYEKSGWFTAFIGGSHEWLRDDGKGGRYLDADARLRPEDFAPTREERG